MSSLSLWAFKRILEAQVGEVMSCWEELSGSTHGHSQAGFHSRSGWGGTSWRWSPGAGNLSDNGRARCFQPVAGMEVPRITFHPVMLHTHPSTAYFPTTHLPTLLLLCLITSYLSLEAAYIMPLPRGFLQLPGPGQRSCGIYLSLQQWMEYLTHNQKTLAVSSGVHIYSWMTGCTKLSTPQPLWCRPGNSPATTTVECCDAQMWGWVWKHFLTCEELWDVEYYCACLFPP